MKQLLTLICGATLIVAYAQAQTNTTSSAKTSSPATTSMTTDASKTTASTTNSSGTVTDYTPGAAITLDPGTGRPVRFVIGQKVQVLGPDGKVLADTDVKKKAVFALSQLPRDEGVPLLIQVARTNRNPAVRKQAIFWLGQSQDSRALQFFEEVLLR